MSHSFTIDHLARARGVSFPRRRTILGGLLLLPGIAPALGGAPAAQAKNKKNKKPHITKNKKPHVAVQVVIEEGPVATAPVTPQGFAFVTAKATCSQGVAIAGGFRTSSPSGFGVEANDSYASSSTEWTVRALAQEAGATLTVSVTCLIT
jgi:hypothetical protein